MRCCCIETRDVVILQKIVMYCLRITENLDRFHHDFFAFENDHLFQDACCMCVVQIGELVALPGQGKGPAGYEEFLCSFLWRY